MADIVLPDAADAVDLIRRRVAENGDRVAISTPDFDRPDATVRMSYRDLDARARDISNSLRKRFTPGSRVLVLHPSGTGFASAFLGVLYAGMVAVPAPLPGKYAQQRRRVHRIVEDAGIQVALTDASHFLAVQDWAAEEGLAGLDVVSSGAEVTGDAVPWAPPDIDRSAVAMLQYTSGSTGDPKGVVVTHGNLLHNVGLLGRAMGFTEETRYGCWLPLYHDMGLIGHLLPALFSGSECVLMTPTSFLRHPVRWLQLIDRYRINHSAAPNFAFEQCARTVTDEQLSTLDLSSWQSAVNGSEPIMAESLRAFVKRFSAAGFAESAMAPSYGLAEATLFVSGANDRAPVITSVDTKSLEQGVIRVSKTPDTGTELVSCGVPHAFDLRIVDEKTHTEVPPGNIGEIWLHGGSVTRGYWRNAAGTAECFDATLASRPYRYLRTGDLGFLHDGELYVTGRIKELLIVRGRNLYPQDIEYEVRTHIDELRGGTGVVFAVGAHDDQLIVAHELRGRVAEETARNIISSIRLTVSREFGVRPAGVVLLRPGRVRRTTSGKIQRAAMRELFLSRSLDPVHESLDPSLVAMSNGSPGRGE